MSGDLCKNYTAEQSLHDQLLLLWINSVQPTACENKAIDKQKYKEKTNLKGKIKSRVTNES